MWCKLLDAPSLAPDALHTFHTDGVLWRECVLKIFTLSTLRSEVIDIVDELRW